MSAWLTRIDNATKYKRAWEHTYKCERLYDYYKGFQWKHRGVAQADYNPYTLNLVFSTIEIKCANILFKKPSFIVAPRPGNSDWNQEAAIQSAQIKQDVLNTLTNRPNAKFKANMKRAALDSFFRFGVMEVGYAADWRNPISQKPLLSNRDDEVKEDEGRVVEDNEIPENERIYFKRVKASRFLVSAADSEDIENCDWCGYWEYYYTSHLKKNKSLAFPKKYETREFSSDYFSEKSLVGQTDSLREFFESGQVSKVYHIFDNVAKERRLILDSGEELFSTPFERFPFATLRWIDPLDGWYSVPPVFHWLSSQDEINESREQMRNYRKRYTRKFQVVANTIEQEEEEKFASGTDGELIHVKRENAIMPIQNPELGSAIPNALMIAKDDFNIISGTSSEQRGQADRQTATQSKLIESRTQIRESAEQEVFKDFVIEVARETLLQAGENLAIGIWVQLTADPGDTIGEELQMTPAYQLIAANDIQDGYDFDVDIDVVNGSSLAADEEKTHFLEFLAVVNTYPQISLSPILIREAAHRVGYRNEKVIREMQRAAQLNLLAQAAQVQGAGAAQGGENSSNAAQTQLAQEQPNSVEQTETQMINQLGV